MNDGWNIINFATLTLNQQQIIVFISFLEPENKSKKANYFSTDARYRECFLCSVCFCLGVQAVAGFSKITQVNPLYKNRLYFVPLAIWQCLGFKIVFVFLQPIVKLLINRHNNKYSYTPTSDDNLLKNIELFDRLSLRFSERVLFIKDVIGSNEICCWSFFGHGKKVAEVCCTSIVYTTDKKHTKVSSGIQFFFR